LVELLVVVLILAILMAVALPLYLSAVQDSEQKTCFANMQTIASAEQAFKVRSAGHQYTSDMTQLNADLQKTPTCPKTGAYSVTTNADGTIKINCTVHGDYNP